MTNIHTKLKQAIDATALSADFSGVVYVDENEEVVHKSSHGYINDQTNL
ncbi:hypothetical protein ACFQ3N_07565 [Virgibacillus byunsanensis]|uniref:Uncharacterized protein n=1 Tax=Virgibacillus byunsanensis TaxID=570945 RepID=A0ABW3LIX4_9BACI